MRNTVCWSKLSFELAYYLIFNASINYHFVGYDVIMAPIDTEKYNENLKEHVFGFYLYYALKEFSTYRDYIVHLTFVNLFIFAWIT